MGALVLVVGALLTGVLLAIVPPTAEGDWGWIVAAVVITMRLAAAAWLATGRGPVRYGVVYAISLLSIAGLCLLQYLATDQAYFHDLVLIDLLYVAAVHTPQRTAAAVALAVAGFLPGAWTSEGTLTSVSIAEWAAEAVLWALVAGLVALYTRHDRAGSAPRCAAPASARRRSRASTPLTGLGNRRAFDECFERELSAARRYGTRAEHPHRRPRRLQGRQRRATATRPATTLLRAVADRLAETVRRPDACFRWGGDEFAVILPRTGLDEAELVAARIRAALTREVRDPGGTPAAISLGVAELGTDQEPRRAPRGRRRRAARRQDAAPGARPPALRPPRGARRRRR